MTLTMPAEQTGFVAVLKRRWLLVLMSIVLGGLLSFLYSSHEVRTFESDAVLLVQAPEDNGVALESAGAAAPTYADLVTTRPVLAATIASLRLPDDVSELRSRVVAEADRQTRLVTIRVTGHDRRLTGRIAASLATNVRDAVNTRAALDTPLPNSPTGLRLFEGATTSKVSPDVPLTTFFGILGGLFAGIGLALFRGAGRKTVADGEELAALVRVPLLGTVEIPVDPDSDGLGRAPAPGPPVGVPLLAGRLRTADPADPLRSVCIIGVDLAAAAGEIAASLAEAYAAMGLRVVLVADASLPGAAGAETAVVRVEFGIAPPDIPALLAAADLVVAAVPSVAAGLRWSRAADATVLAAAAGTTRRTAVISAAAAVRSARGTLTAVITVRERPVWATRRDAPPAASQRGRPLLG